MAAMMVLMFVMMMTGPHDGFARPDVVHPPQTEAPYAWTERAAPRAE